MLEIFALQERYLVLKYGEKVCCRPEVELRTMMVFRLELISSGEAKAVVLDNLHV